MSLRERPASSGGEDLFIAGRKRSDQRLKDRVRYMET